MNVLKLVGLVILGGLALGLFVIIYPKIQGLWASEQARDVADKINSAIESTINTGNPENISIEIPAGYWLRFDENMIIINGIRMPEGGYPRPVKGPTLGPGRHDLSVRIEKGIVKIKEAT